MDIKNPPLRGGHRCLIVSLNIANINVINNISKYWACF